jgi:hypothetical protein
MATKKAMHRPTIHLMSETAKATATKKPAAKRKAKSGHESNGEPKLAGKPMRYVPHNVVSWVETSANQLRCNILLKLATSEAKANAKEFIGVEITLPKIKLGVLIRELKKADSWMRDCD